MAGKAGKPKIGDDRPDSAGAFPENDVTAFQVAVDNALFVRFGEAVAELKGELAQIVDRQRSLIANALLQGFTRKVLHGEEADFAIGSDRRLHGMNAADVLVGHLDREAGFVTEAVAVGGVRHFQSDVGAHGLIAGLVDDGHAAFIDFANDAVAFSQQGVGLEGVALLRAEDGLVEKASHFQFPVDALKDFVPQVRLLRAVPAHPALAVGVGNPQGGFDERHHQFVATRGILSHASGLVPKAHEQPVAGILPAALHGSEVHVQQFGGLFITQSKEVPHLHDLTVKRIFYGEFVEQAVQAEQGVGIVLGEDEAVEEGGVQGNEFDSGPPAGAVDEVVSHHAGGERIEMAAAFPGAILGGDELEIRFRD